MGGVCRVRDWAVSPELGMTFSAFHTAWVSESGRD